MLLIFVIFKPETMAIEERIYGIKKTDKRPTYVTGRDLNITPSPGATLVYALTSMV